MIGDFGSIDYRENLRRKAEKVAQRIHHLKAYLKGKRIPVIYANDNFGEWRSDFRNLVQHCLASDKPEAGIAQRLHPEPDDYFILKPKHSAFYSTVLEMLLGYLGIKRLILTGLTTNQCVLFTANDAHMRDYDIVIPRDCVVSRNRREEVAAFIHFEKVLRVNTASSKQLLREFRTK